MAEAIPFGPFELLDPIGSGGMAEVWRGVYRRQGTPIAAKIITSRRALLLPFRDALRNEVRAMAALEHPNIITVHDFGEVSEEVARASGGRLESHCPYLVMELADGGTLSDLRTPLRWRTLRSVLVALLDALAHAHARGVVHLDLKPQNVLLVRGDGPGIGLKLTDFGIARALDFPMTLSATDRQAWFDLHLPGDASSTLVGTPSYMAPEQFLGEWRELGPWTDLYALGCVTYELVTGRPPFINPDALQLAQAHWNQTPPLLIPRIEVPRGFEAWVLRLLEKRPARRFQRVADAAWALQQLDETDLSVDPGRDPISRLEAELQEALPARHISDLQSTDPSADRQLLYDPPLSIHARHRGPRPPSAAPASQAWPGTGAPSQVPGAGSIPSPFATEEEIRLLEAFSLSSGPDLEAAFPTGAPSPLEGAARLTSADVPPLPHSWRDARPSPPAPLYGVGLGVYTMRSVPLVGRFPERDALWDELRRVHHTGRVRAVILQGAAGVGKSRLVEWLSFRAHEVGAATVLKAVHSPSGGPMEGLSPMLARHLNCTGLSGPEALERVTRTLLEQGLEDADEWSALTELVVPGPDDPGTAGGIPAADAALSGMRSRTQTRQERYAVLHRHLERMAAERMVIVRLEDVQWGLDTLEFALHLLKTRRAAPASILLLMTVKEEALLERPDEAALLETLATQDGVSRLSISPLPAADHSALIRQLLGLDEELAGRVEERTRGNPLFAMQLVGDWVERGVLEPAATGFVLKPGEAAELPESIHEIWLRRVRRALAQAPAHALPALELAAALGHTIGYSEWQDAAGEESIPLADAWIDVLVSHQLLQPAEQGMVTEGKDARGWTFGHALLRESLERSAREAGRWATHHRACAAMLRRHDQGDRRKFSARFARHSLEAGDHAMAIEPLLDAAVEEERRGRFAQARTLLARREQALLAAGVLEIDRRWARGWLLQASVSRALGRLDAATAFADRAEEAARRYGWTDLTARILRTRAAIVHNRGDLDEAIRLCEQALLLFREQRDWPGIAHSLRALATCQMETADHENVPALLHEALHWYSRLDDSDGRAETLLNLGRYYQRLQDTVRAATLQLDARALYEKVGNRRGVADTLRELGLLAMDENDMDIALEHFSRAMAIYQSLGSEGEQAALLHDIAAIHRSRGAVPGTG